LLSTHHHGIIAIQANLGLCDRNATSTSGKQLPPDLGSNLVMTMVEKEIQESLSLVLGNYVE